MKTAVAFVVTLIAFSFPHCVQAQETVSLPTDEEIQLLATQAERAMQQYKVLIGQEELSLGDNGKGAVAKDRQVIAGIELGTRAFTKAPQGFNGPLGFAFVEWLDDASRNALLCSSTALSQAMDLAMNGKTREAVEVVELSKACSDASTLIYTVSENAGALYSRYAKAVQIGLERASNTARKCGEALQQTQAPRKP